DLDHHIRFARLQRVDDLPLQVRIHEEVLAERLLGAHAPIQLLTRTAVRSSGGTLSFARSARLKRWSSTSAGARSRSFTTSASRFASPLAPRASANASDRPSVNRHSRSEPPCQLHTASP